MSAAANLFVGGEPDTGRGGGAPKRESHQLPPDFWLLLLLIAAALSIGVANWLGFLD